MHSLTTLLGSIVGARVDRFRSPLATPIALSLSDGRQIHVVARFNWSVWTSLSDAAEGPGLALRSAATRRPERRA